MNKYYLTFLFLLIFTNSYCGQSNKASYVNENNKIWKTNIGFQIDTSLFVPDTSVNEILFLENPNSTINVFENISSLVRFHDDDFPNVYFINSDKREYLKLTIYPGTTINDISAFEIGYTSLLNNEVISRSLKNTH